MAKGVYFEEEGDFLAAGADLGLVLVVAGLCALVFVALGADLGLVFVLAGLCALVFVVVGADLGLVLVVAGLWVLGFAAVGADLGLVFVPTGLWALVVVAVAAGLAILLATVLGRRSFAYRCAFFRGCRRLFGETFQHLLGNLRLLVARFSWMGISITSFEYFSSFRFFISFSHNK